MVRLIVFMTLIFVAAWGCAQDALTEERSRANVTVESRKTLSTTGSTRATAYAPSNKIITSEEKVFVAWLDAPAMIRIATYHVEENWWDEPVTLGEGVDNHSGPGITMDGQGYLYASFGPHVGEFQFRSSLRPRDAGAWGPVETFGDKATYPALYCSPDDTLHLTYRGDAPPRKALYQRRPKGETWSDPVALVDAGVPDGYTQFGSTFAIARDGTIHLAFHIHDIHPKAGKAVGYLRSTDGGRSWVNAAGKKLDLPVTPKSPCFVEQGADLDMRIGSLVLDAKARPWLLVSHVGKPPRTVRLWHLDGMRWRSIDLGPTVRSRFDGREPVAGTMTLDLDGRLYAALTTVHADIADSSWYGHPSSEIVLLTSGDFRETFVATMISKPDDSFPNWLPSIERPYGANPIGIPSLIYTHGGPGKSPAGEGTEVVYVKLRR